ncbi:PilZ domain-containing protein [Colwellia chukchiensis]|uniref:PilZ domain-containing protein n=1 Tax=Colwellia chukchiensis TaxID=641665 RepID=A0A1H7QTF4_9GAMM|nr:PilZ domain-containing protein [Colwellia chukchiensis]SEL50905.1 PilZ domain-containing protein [Colwellia chukchiensis]
MSEEDQDLTSAASERRQAFRIDMEKELIDMRWTDSHGRQQAKKIACLDFSRGGLKVDCDCDIETNTEVTVIFQASKPKSQQLVAKVLRSVKQDNGWYQVAMQLTDLA